MKDNSLKPPPLAEREAAFKKKIAQQTPAPLGQAPTPTDAPRIVPDPMKGNK